jgi:hypothetical protein
MTQPGKTSGICSESAGNLECLDLDHPEWDALVRTCREWHPFYLSGFVSTEAAFHQADGQLLVFRAGEGIAVYPVLAFAFRSGAAIAYDLRGQPYAGPISSAADPSCHSGLLNGLRSAMSEMADTRGWVTDFCRLNPFTHTPFTKQHVSHVSNHVYVDFTRGYERIWKEYRPSARRDVKRANEGRVELRPLANEAEHLSFADLYRIRMVELGASPRYCFDHAYLAALNRNLRHHCLTLGAFVDDRLAGASLNLRGNGYMFAYIAAADSAYRRFRLSHGLHDLAIRIGLRDGYKAYVLGGGVHGEDSVYSYKRSLSPAVFSQLRLNNVLDRERYEQLCAQSSVQEETTDFFPPYRQGKAGSHAA